MIYRNFSFWYFSILHSRHFQWMGHLVFLLSNLWDWNQIEVKNLSWTSSMPRRHNRIWYLSWQSHMLQWVFSYLLLIKTTIQFHIIFWTNLKIWYNCYILDAWGEWSSCSVTCGSGTRTRTRTCPDSMCSDSDSASETDTCPSNPTCYSKLQRNTRWYILVTYNEITGDWGEWSSCSVTCGTGTRTRTRTCPDSMCSASESSSETDNCPNNPSCMGKDQHT